jgi:hypothetical protein
LTGVVRRSFKPAAEMPRGEATETADASIETGPADVTPVPETALAKAQADLAENDQAIAGLAAERNALLLQDDVDETAVERVDGELARHQRRQMTLTDRLSLLAAEAQREAAEQAAQVHEAKIIEAERLFIARDAAAMELRDHLAAAEAAFRKVYELGVAARAAWPWEHGRAGGTLTTAHDLVREVGAFLYKIGGRPALLGGQFPANVPPAFPGAKCPRIELLQLPDKLPDLAAEYGAASRYASDVMRGVVRVDAVPPSPASPGVAAEAPATTPPVVAAAAGPNVPSIGPEVRKLLERQNALASRDMSEADEREYQENSRLIQEMSA